VRENAVDNALFPPDQMADSRSSICVPITTHVNGLIGSGKAIRAGLAFWRNLGPIRVQ